MPLDKRMRMIKGNFIRQYGRSRGTPIYYAWENKQNHNDTLTLKLPHDKAIKFYRHLKKEHPTYSRGLKLR